MDVLVQLFWFALVLAALAAPYVAITQFGPAWRLAKRAFAAVVKLWPQPSDNAWENRGNKLLAKRIAFCAVPIVGFLFVISAVRLILLLVNPPEGGGLFGGGTDFRVHYLAFVGVATFLVALIGLPFALFRYEALERQTSAQEEGLITDRINKAVESLGADKVTSRMGRTITYEHQGRQQSLHQWYDDRDVEPDIPDDAKSINFGKWESFNQSTPNLEVRIGAIYALERIAQDNLDWHIQIMEILCAYIRQNAPATEASRVADQISVKPRSDIQTALTVIGRRSRKQKEVEWGSWRPFDEFEDRILARNFEIDANQDTEMERMGEVLRKQWHEALFRWNVIGPKFRLDLAGTDLRGAMMDGHRRSADFSRAVFNGACLQGVDFAFADLQGATFIGAQAQGTDFSDTAAHGAQFQLIALSGETTFENATLVSATFDCDLRMVDLTQSQIDMTFSHGSTELPEGIEKPRTWPSHILGDVEYFDEWHKWLRLGKDYTPPPKPSDALYVSVSAS